ncbi:MAG: SIS domain-containing protein [Gemmatimonas sp.]
MGINEYFAETASLLKACAEANLAPRIDEAIRQIAAALKGDRCVLVCGNGGSASDAMHIAGELVGRYLKERRALKAIALSADPAVLTALGNDYGYEHVFSRQVEALAETGGIFIGLSTSGNSPNVVKACEMAKHLAMYTIAITGQGGGKLKGVADILIDVPSKATPRIQEAHLCIYHYICEQVEAALA